jgi:hypothetical protein
MSGKVGRESDAGRPDRQPKEQRKQPPGGGPQPVDRGSAQRAPLTGRGKAAMGAAGTVTALGVGAAVIAGLAALFAETDFIHDPKVIAQLGFSGMGAAIAGAIGMGAAHKMGRGASGQVAPQEELMTPEQVQQAADSAHRQLLNIREYADRAPKRVNLSNVLKAASKLMVDEEGHPKLTEDANRIADIVRPLNAAVPAEMERLAAEAEVDPDSEESLLTQLVAKNNGNKKIHEWPEGPAQDLACLIMALNRLQPKARTLF